MILKDIFLSRDIFLSTIDWILFISELQLKLGFDDNF